MDAWEETRQERLDFADFLATLDDADWDSMTPAHDWRVRDVVGHVIQGATQSTMSTVIGLTSYRARYNAYYDGRDVRVRQCGERSRHPADCRDRSYSA